MNVQEYISTGIVESYVLGLADPEERAEFERMCAAHPEVRTARDEFELSLELHAVQNGLAPLSRTKSKIFAELDVEADRNSANNGAAPVYSIDHRESGSVSRPANISWLRYLAAASVVLLVGSTALNLYFFNQYRTYSQRYDELLAQQSNLASNNQAMQTKLQQYEEALSLVSSPTMLVVRATGTNAPSSPDTSGLATVYWDSRTKDVYLTVNNLPPADAAKQYQLWAIVDGKPVDAGVFDLKDGASLLKMKNIQRADVFAITLEKRGGVPSPEGPIYVLGKV